MRNIVVSLAISFMAASVSFAADSVSENTELQTLRQRVEQLEKSTFVPSGLVRKGSRTGYAVAASCAEISETGWQYGGAYEIQVVKTLKCGDKTYYLVRTRGNALNPQPVSMVDAEYVSLY